MMIERQISLPFHILFTSGDKMIHKDSGLLTITCYTAIGSGFVTQGIPAEKPRNLLTHPPSQSNVSLPGLLLLC